MEPIGTHAGRACRAGMTRTHDIDAGRPGRATRLTPGPRRNRGDRGLRTRRRGDACRARHLLAISALGLLTLSTAPPAHAYLDPGTGSMILQVILGGVAGLVVAGKLYWKRVKEFFGRPGSEATPGASESANDTTAD